MPRAGPKKVLRYSLEFKRSAVRLSEMETSLVPTLLGKGAEK